MAARSIRGRIPYSLFDFCRFAIRQNYRKETKKKKNNKTIGILEAKRVVAQKRDREINNKKYIIGKILVNVVYKLFQSKHFVFITRKRVFSKVERLQRFSKHMETWRASFTNFHLGMISPKTFT